MALSRYLAAAVVLVAGAHLGAGTASAQQGASARVLTITARDYAFEAPASVPAGLTEVRLVNAGPELHHSFFIRLDEGKTPADFRAAMQQGESFPAWARQLGGPNTPVPGKTSVAVMDLKPGTYIVTCVIPSPDGKPHFTKGMTHILTVTPPSVAQPASAGADARVAVSAPTVTMKLVDYGYDLATPIKAGRQVVRVQNAAEQSHEVVIARLAPGKTPQDLLTWMERPNGPPPGEPVGGTVALAKGEWNDLVIDFAPGEYALLCFIPDHKDGKPHVAHGMIRTISVK